MSVPIKSIIESRLHQIFPVLEAPDIKRMRRFGTLRSFRAGEFLARTGQVADGLTIILAGKVESRRRIKLAHHGPIATRASGKRMGESAKPEVRLPLRDAALRED